MRHVLHLHKKGDKPKQSHVTERTWHLVRFRKWLLKSIKVLGNRGVLPADVHSVVWKFMSSSFLEEPSCRTDPLFLELYLFAVWSFDAFVVNYHPAWQVFRRSAAFAFPEVAQDAQLRMELLRIPLLSEHEQRVCNVRSALLSLIKYSKRLLSQWINADKVAFLEGIAGGVGGGSLRWYITRGVTEDQVSPGVGIEKEETSSTCA